MGYCSCKGQMEGSSGNMENMYFRPSVETLKIRPLQQIYFFRFVSDRKKKKITSFHCSKLLLECQIPQGISQKIFLAHNFLSNTPLLQEEYVQVYFFELYLDFLSMEKDDIAISKLIRFSAFSTNFRSRRPSPLFPYSS